MTSKPNACAACGGLGWIRRGEMCPGCVRRFGHPSVKLRVQKKRESHMIAEGRKSVRRWQDRHDRCTRSVYDRA